MATETRVKQPTYDIFRTDRPGWIPEWVGGVALGAGVVLVGFGFRKR